MNHSGRLQGDLSRTCEATVESGASKDIPFLLPFLTENGFLGHGVEKGSVVLSEKAWRVELSLQQKAAYHLPCEAVGKPRLHRS